VTWRCAREQLGRLYAHVELASRINRAIDERALEDLGTLEQDLVYGDATSKEVITFLSNKDNAGALPADKVCSMLPTQFVSSLLTFELRITARDLLTIAPPSSVGNEVDLHVLSTWYTALGSQCSYYAEYQDVIAGKNVGQSARLGRCRYGC